MVHTKTEQTWESHISYQRDKDYSWHQLHLELWSETDPKAKNTNILCVTWGQVGVTLTIKSSIFYLPLLILKHRQWYTYDRLLTRYYDVSYLKFSVLSLWFSCAEPHLYHDFDIIEPTVESAWTYGTVCMLTLKGLVMCNL